MAKATSETTVSPDISIAANSGFELQFLDTLGPSAGPEAYLYMAAIIESGPENVKHLKHEVLYCKRVQL